MATKTTTKLIDDIDGSDKDVQTITFALDGTNYAIELSPKNEGKLRDALEPYRSVARKVGRGGKTTKSAPTGPDPKEVKAWADTQGIDYPKRGRLSRELVDAYNAAH